MDKKNGDNSDEHNGKVPCPYCHKRIKHLGMHQSNCPLKLQNEEVCNIAEKGPASTKDLQKQTSEAQFKFNNILQIVQLKPEDNNEMIKIDALMTHSLQILNSCKPLKWIQMNSGSYYSNVKVSNSKEFDYMFCPTVIQCRIEQYLPRPNYCHVFVTNKTKLPFEFQELLGPDDELSPSKFKEYVFSVFDYIVRETYNNQLTRKNTYSLNPAYTVEYKYRSSDIQTIDIDWAPCLEVQEWPDSCMDWKTKMLTDEEKMDTKLYVVPKKLAAGAEELELWQISYSTFEKEIIRDKCKETEQTVIRFLKYVLADVKDDNSKLCSYHIKIHCLHMFEKMVQQPELKEYIFNAIDAFIIRLQLRDLPHFFIPTINLLQDVDVKECEKYIQKFKNYREQLTDK